MNDALLGMGCVRQGISLSSISGDNGKKSHWKWPVLIAPSNVLMTCRPKRLDPTANADGGRERCPRGLLAFEGPERVAQTFFGYPPLGFRHHQWEPVNGGMCAFGLHISNVC